jgi:hypothetical protein
MSNRCFLINTCRSLGDDNNIVIAVVVVADLVDIVKGVTGVDCSGPPRPDRLFRLIKQIIVYVFLQYSQTYVQLPPSGPKSVAVVGRWSLLRGHLCYKSSQWNLNMVVVIDRKSQYGGGS